MGKIEITKKDILWGYAGQFFMIGSGLFTLPVILRMLTSEEIGMNYLMLTVSTMVSLLDFGFSSQLYIKYFSNFFMWIFQSVWPKFHIGA